MVAHPRPIVALQQHLVNDHIWPDDGAFCGDGDDMLIVLFFAAAAAIAVAMSILYAPRTSQRSLRAFSQVLCRFTYSVPPYL
jgi:hypothetical protein